jgi:hypothetical protein
VGLRNARTCLNLQLLIMQHRILCLFFFGICYYWSIPIIAQTDSTLLRPFPGSWLLIEMGSEKDYAALAAPTKYDIMPDYHLELPTRLLTTQVLWSFKEDGQLLISNQVQIGSWAYHKSGKIRLAGALLEDDLVWDFEAESNELLLRYYVQGYMVRLRFVSSK